MPRNNILLRRLPTTKQVQLPTGRVFYAKYQHVGPNQLPQDVRVRRTYVRKIGPRRQRKRRQQEGRGLDLPTKSLLSSAMSLGKK